jgi:hypothetical protein
MKELEEGNPLLRINPYTGDMQNNASHKEDFPLPSFFLTPVLLPI